MEGTTDEDSMLGFDTVGEYGRVDVTRKAEAEVILRPVEIGQGSAYPPVG